MNKEYEPEKDGGVSADVALGYTGEENNVSKSDFAANNTWYGKLQGFAGKLGVEQRGIERVPEDERTDTTMSKVGTVVSFNSAKSALACSISITHRSGSLPTWSSRRSLLALLPSLSSAWALLTPP